jgi:formylglycine-generating enzyme required for sulfatase activity
MNARAIIDPSWHPLVTGCPPAWASEWGEDRQGVFVAFTLGEVTQRLRWIPPGRFEMGSPDGEPGRDDDEGPRHTVYLSRGYWLFDTPCTQALWQEVMGSNPSMFQSPDRPVEQVSWDDVQGFLDRINGRIPGLELVLPTEAQWEYACRAGTDTALYTGGIEIKGDANAPALDPIAWYGGNSGVDFELDNGLERTWLSDMQFPEGKAGTHPVGRKDRNPWGLYDMLGNVWEWCADGWRPYDADWKLDPVGPSEAGADRVIRGGSWDYDARYCRSAYRIDGLPDYRNDYLGFRCARVQAAP